MSGSKSVPKPHRTLHTLISSGAPFTLQELEAAIGAAIHEQAAGTEEQEWTVAEILQEMHLNLKRGGMFGDWRERNAERKKARELFEKELGAKGRSALEKRSKEQIEEEQRAQEQKWKELEAKELKKNKAKKEKKKSFWPKTSNPWVEKTQPWPFPG